MSDTVAPSRRVTDQSIFDLLPALWWQGVRIPCSGLRVKVLAPSAAPHEGAWDVNARYSQPDGRSKAFPIFARVSEVAFFVPFSISLR